ncbi:MAG TPA: ribosomal-protein-alanine N-acetyltransferase [Peptococcaceae bacterium]|nr:ribosomal-protein-alanine N-acetyltransferase [Peptococcaceae bacterium]
MEVTIRPMKIWDLPQILNIENCSFPAPWSYRAFVSELNNSHGVYFVALIGEIIVGYAGMWLLPGEAHVTTVAVHPDYRGRKIGRKLMNTLIDFARIRGAQTMLLEVRPSNLPARKLYHSLGFRQIGLRVNYYVETGEDAIVMLKYLQETEDCEKPEEQEGLR